MKISDAEYPALKAFFLAMFNATNCEVPPDVHPARFIDQLEQMSMARARTGLAQAIGDLIEQTSIFPRETVESADQQLAAAGLPTLTQVRARHGKALRTLIKRGKARNETEYYLAKGMIDGAADILSDADLAALTKIVSDFEGA